MFAKWLKNKNLWYECAMCVAHVFYGMHKEVILSLSQTPPVWIRNSHQSHARAEACLFWASLWSHNLCSNLHSPGIFVFMRHSITLQSKPQNMGWERFWQRMPMSCGIPQRCPRMRPQESLGCWPDPGNSGGWHRGREPMSLGCLQCCYMTPPHWAAVSITVDIHFD